jgi:DNA-binding HxlR family transcriptional regulator
MIRDGLNGFTRFYEFQKSLNIAPNMLTRRLNALVDAGLAACRYSKWPPRFEYILTESDAISGRWSSRWPPWGNRHFAPAGASAVLVDEKLEDRSMTATFSLPPAPLLTSGHVAATQSLIQQSRSNAAAKERCRSRKPSE